MELYLQSEDPLLIFMKDIGACAPTWSGDDGILSGVSWVPGDKGVFARFIQSYRAIVISSGLPRNDYGQTVHLYSPGQFTEPDPESLPESSRVPDHIFSENLPFSPSMMTGEYRFRQSEDNRHPDNPKVTEEFFFPYKGDWQPARFVDVANSLGALRYLSEIVHQLSLFEVVLMEAGIYVKLKAYVVASKKPRFVMAS